MVDGYQPIEAEIGMRRESAVARSDSYRWVIVTVLLLAVTTAFFDRINIAVLFANPDFKSAIGVGNNPPLLGLLMTAFVFAYGVSAVFLSIVSDLVGPKRTLASIAIVLAVVMAAMGGSASYAAMFTGRILLGIAEGPQFGTANVAVKQWFRPGERGLASALWSVGAPLGSMIGFPLVIFLVAAYGWRSSFYILAALNGLLVLPAVWFLFRDQFSSARDAKGAGGDVVPLGQAIAILLSSGPFWLLAVYDCGAMIYLWGFNSWLPAYLQEARHFDVRHSGMFSSLPFLFMIIGSFAGGALGDKYCCKAWICLVGLSSAGLLIAAAACVENATLAALLLALSAGGWGTTVPTLFAMSSEIIPPRVTSMGFGIYAGLANIVGALSPFAMGLAIGRNGNYTAALLLITLSCVVLSLAIVPLVRRH